MSIISDLVLKPVVCLAVLVIVMLEFTSALGGTAEDLGQSLTYSAVVNLTYRDPWTGEMISEEEDMGLYATDSRLDDEAGWVVHIRTIQGTNDGCTLPVNAPPATDKWIALIERGSCRFHQKISNVAVTLNASAVVIYNNEHNSELLSMKHKVEDVVSVFIKKQSGERIAALVDNGTRVWMHVSVGSSHPPLSYSPVNRTSVLFVSVSFIVLMMISLAWLVFYYVQRFRYVHTKDRLAKRLMNAAKKAVNKMGQRVLRRGDKETDSEFELCAICVETYKVGETVRILPCKHFFHKGCVDPWLIEHRTCPICKLDILHAYGIHVMGNRELTTTTNLGFPYLLTPDSIAQISAANDIPEPMLPVRASRSISASSSVTRGVSTSGSGGIGESDLEFLLETTSSGTCTAPPSQRGVNVSSAQVHCSMDDPRLTSSSPDHDDNYDVADDDDDRIKLSVVEC